MVQQGTGLRLTISSPTLEVLPVGEDGTVFDRHIAFGFTGDTGYEGWSSTYLQDHLGPTESLGFDGSVDGAVTDAEIRATMDGDMEYWDSAAPAKFGPNAICRAHDHSVVLRRATAPKSGSARVATRVCPPTMSAVACAGFLLVSGTMR